MMLFRRRTCLLAALLATAFGTACVEQDTETIARTELAPEGFDVPRTKHDGPLPAFRSEAERKAGKADEFDVRGNYTEIYGATEPPSSARAVAEFERTDAVLIDWDDYLTPFMARLVDTVSREAEVHLVTDDLEHSGLVRDYLRRNGTDVSRVRFFEFFNDSFWTRDYGPVPIALSDGAPAAVDAVYYPERRRDDAIPTLMSRYFGFPAYRPALQTEGGNFMTNGEGLCVATEWLLQENPQLRRSEIEAIKREYYGCEDLVILERMAGEGTGHVDMFAKFVSRDTVLVGQYEYHVDPQNAAILDRNAEALENLRLTDGSRLEVVRIPMPYPTHPIYPSYTNSVIVNRTAIIPVYPSDRSNEAEALRVYRDTLPPDFEIVTIDSDAVIEYGGAVHCTTMGFVLDDVRPPSGDRPTDPEPPSGGRSERYESQPMAAIVDLHATQDIIEVPSSGAAGRVVVEVELSHSHVGDLVVYLEHAGQQQILHDRSGDSQTSLRREYGLDAFADLPRGGEWTLVVEDHARYDEGTLERWALHFE